MSEITRRKVLAVGSAGATALIAGCNASSDTGGNGTGNETEDGSDGSDEPAEPSITIVSPEDGATVEANEFVEFEAEVENFELRQTNINPDSVSGPGGYIITSLANEGGFTVEERVFEEGETVELGRGVKSIKDGTSSQSRIIGKVDEYTIVAQLVNSDDTATQYYDTVTVETETEP